MSKKKQKYVEMTPAQFFSKERFIAAGATKYLDTRCNNAIRNSDWCDHGRVDSKDMKEFLRRYPTTSRLWSINGIGRLGLMTAVKLLRTAKLRIKDGTGI